MQIDFRYPKRLSQVMKPGYDYKIIYGGRSSAKTATVIRYLISRAIQKPITILCCRQFQSSIEVSTYAELRAYIYENNLQDLFIVKHDKIVGTNGSQFIFKGLERDIMGVKGIPKIMICYIDEAETITDYSWEVLIPTIERNEGSEIIITFNPREGNSPTYQKFVQKSHDLPGNVLKIEQNYNDNPYLSAKLRQTIEKLKETNYAQYEHIYLGKVLDLSEAVIFKGCFEIREIEIPQSAKPKYGSDFGFSQDPFATVECYTINEDTIYINNEIYEIGLLPTRIPERFKQTMPLTKNNRIFADCARPDTIAELKNMGLNIVGAEKFKGSVESGIQYLQGKKLIVNPRCKNMIYELYNYKYEQNKEGDILPKPIDAFNHLIDSLRYAYSLQISALRRTVRVNQSTLGKF